MKRAEHQPETVSLTIYAGIYYKVWRVPDADTLIPQHSHAFGHLTAVLQGMVRVWRDDEHIGDFMAPATVRIPAHAVHRFLTLTPGCLLACIHNATDLEDGEPNVFAEHNLELED
jgi:quercetin dioxygenase-like cupin family protein